VADHAAAPGQDRGLRGEALGADVPREGAKLAGIDPLPDGHDRLDRQLCQALQNASEQVA
jgi:hypothetical protein